MTLWVEKYRPKTIDDVILPDRLKEPFKQMVETQSLSNMILNGGPGLGKTTIARALCNQLNVDMIFINGSDERNIDTLRTKIRQFCSTVSLSGGMKVVIIDEADYLNPNSTQPAMRAFIEEFSSHCRFIFTCNNKNKIIEPLHSRCSVFDLTIKKKEMSLMAASFFKRIKKILDAESIIYEDKALVGVIERMAPDWRRILNTLQSYSSAGKIDFGIYSTLEDSTIYDLIKFLKDKDFKNMRQWVGQNNDIEPTVLFRKLYDIASDKMEPESIPSLILILAEWQYKSSMVMDQEINTAACLTEVMSQVRWK